MKIVVHWLIATIAIVITAYILPGVSLSGFWAALVAAVILGLVNAVLRPLILLLTLPINIVTLGLFTLVVNAFMVLITDKLVPGFQVAGFWWALLFGIVLFFVNPALFSILRSKNL